MKYFLPVISFLFFFGKITGQQYVTIGSGANFSTVNGAKTETFKPNNGFFFSIGYHTLFSDPFSFGVDLMLNTKGFRNSYSTSSVTRDFFYSAKVDQVGLSIPFLLTYHAKRFSVDLGPQIEFNNTTQRETEKTIISSYNEQRVVINNYRNRHDLNNNILGFRFGLNINIFQDLDLTAKYLQAFTPPGREYNWQRQRVVQVGIKYNFGKTFTPEKLKFTSESRSSGAEDFRIISSSNIIRATYRYLGEGNDIIFRFRTTDKVHYNLVDIVIGNSSGEVRFTEFENSVRNVIFPFFGNLTFTYQDPSTQSRITYILNFEIVREGNWEVVIYY
jgi:hypothetical protein